VTNRKLEFLICEPVEDALLENDVLSTLLVIQVTSLHLVAKVRGFGGTEELRLLVDFIYLNSRVIDLNHHNLWEPNGHLPPIHYFVRGFLETIGGL